jgi:hypothetical protein
MKPEKIVVVGAEGGKITLFGWKGEQSEWHFMRETDERTLMDMMPEDDREGLCFYSESETVIGWENALLLLNRYPWPSLYPLYVHPEFADLVMSAVRNAPDEYRDHLDSERWEEVCAGKSWYD